MNSPIWHIIKKDMRRFRGLLALWCVALMTRVLVPAWAGDDLRSLTETSLVLSVVLILLLNALIVARALAEDSPLKEAAFWRSRPITGGQMLTAKLVFLAIWTLVVPVAVVAVAACGFGFTPGEALAVMTSQMVLHGVTGVVFVTASILTQRVWTAVLGVMVLFVLAQLLRSPGVTPEPAPVFESLSRQLSNTTVGLAVGVVAVVVALGLVYRDRRRALAVTVLAAGAAGLYGAGRFWPVDFLKALPAFERREARLQPRSEGAIKPVMTNSSWSANGVNYREMQASVSSADLDTDQLRLPYRVEGRVAWGDGAELVQTSEVRLAWPSDLGPALRAQGAVVAPKIGQEAPVEVVTLVRLNDEEMERLQARSAKWEGRVFAADGRMELFARLAAKAGAEVSVGGYRLRMVQTGMRQGRLEVQITEREPSLPRWAGDMSHRSNHVWNTNEFALINRRTKEAMLTVGGGNQGTSQDTFFLFRRSTLTFASTTTGRAIGADEWRAWLAEAELVKFRFREDRRVIIEGAVELAGR